MCAIGSLMWWIEFIFLVICVIKRKMKYKDMSHFTKFMLAFLIIYVVIYVMQYGGSVELRMRGVLYMIVSSLVLSIDKLNLNKKDFIIMSVALAIVFVFATIFAV